MPIHPQAYKVELFPSCTHVIMCVYLSSDVNADFERDEDGEDSRMVVLGCKVDSSFPVLQKNIYGMCVI